MPSILQLLDLDRCPESVDYIENKREFHLHDLLTEQRHDRTWDLGSQVMDDTQGGLRAILSVDEDIEHRLAELSRSPVDLERAVEAIVACVQGGRRVYLYGCGATGRLVKQMESGFWRPFWTRLGRKDRAGALIGEMTGADRALVSSLEGFEDLALLGELQLQDHGIEVGDVVICVTEGGETSSVIGTLMAAAARYQERDFEDARSHLYFVYNNPDEVLRPFERSRSVLDHPAITPINLTTGPQVIAGSTRTQAATIETFVLGVLLEEAAYRLLREELSAEELAAAGFVGDPGIAGRLSDFTATRTAVSGSVEELSRFTEMETMTYRRGGAATYFAGEAILTMFIDCAERSPTFRLFPLDRVDLSPRRSWVQVWTDADSADQAWLRILGRPFRGLDPEVYRRPLEDRVQDPYLRQAALASLEMAGHDQRHCYDFSASLDNIERRSPGPTDLGVIVLVGEEIEACQGMESHFQRFCSLCRERGAKLAILCVADRPRSCRTDADVTVDLVVGAAGDPLGLRRQIALKILLNAHSTATMAKMGRVTGNTMTSVSPSNLKLVGRASFLIMSHVNDALSRGGAWQWPDVESISFAEANAILFDAMAWTRVQELGQTSEVDLSIVRILESVRRGTAVGWEEVRMIVDEEGLSGFLARANPLP
ncbi:MAG: SIS domain-containing protein [Planctomycetota bacterium]|nr:SIS domain-containing protein [Planctomycetota bacterium]